jgi:hypothetical protein
MYFSCLQAGNMYYLSVDVGSQSFVHEQQIDLGDSTAHQHRTEPAREQLTEPQPK